VANASAIEAQVKDEVKKIEQQAAKADERPVAGAPAATPAKVDEPPKAVVTQVSAPAEPAVVVDVVVPVHVPVDLSTQQYNGEVHTVSNGHFNGHSNGVNGNSTNGTADDDDENLGNGNVDALESNVSILTTESLSLGLDITIDSVKDHMQNLTLGEGKQGKEVTTPEPTSPLSESGDEAKDTIASSAINSQED